MPELCRFFGIIIRMYWNDHNPPHFHAICGKQEAIFSLSTLGVIEGGLPPRQLGMVVEWAAQHREELHAAWECVRLAKAPPHIASLE